MKISRRDLLLGSAATLVMPSDASAWVHGLAPVIPSSVWMETPDILAFYVDDSPLLHGNIATFGSPVAQSYGAWFQATNPVTGNTEWGTVIGADKTQVRFSDLPSATFINKNQLHTLGNYSLSGSGAPSITAIYHKDEVIDEGFNFISSSLTLLTRWRHTVYLKLSGQLSNGVTYTVSNSSGVMSNLVFTFNDKYIRAGGIKVSQVGVRADDTFKKVYICSRVPGAPNGGVIDFGGTYGITTAKIIDALSKTTVATVNLVSRRAWNQMETNDGYAATGIDVADTSTGKAVTGISLANPARVTCVGHGFSNGDKVRFRGIAGMIQIEARGPNANIPYVAYTVTVDDADHFFIDQNTSSGFSAFSSTPIFDTSLGGVSNTVYKCFNTNRAGTDVWELDLSSFTTPGNYYIYIPGYGISDPFYLGTEAWAISTAYIHEGVYNLRLGCDVNKSPEYTRPAATVDGLNGCAIYQSSLIASFCTETYSAYAPTGAVLPLAGLGGFSDEGTLTLTNQVWDSLNQVVTATTSVPHGVPNGPLVVNIIGSTPSAFNFIPDNFRGVPSGTPIAGTVTGPSTFTYPMTSNPGTISTPGVALTGFLSSTRVTGIRASTQDAADNDDPGSDHLPGWAFVGFVFNNIPEDSRFTPFTVQLSTELLDPTLYAGTDDLPPLFHEICWYCDNFRVQQQVNGDVPGGFGYPSFSSQIATFPEPIQTNRGWDPTGNRAGQTTMAFVYASDHLTNMCYASAAAQIALICQGYGLTTLATTWYDSAVLAYNRAIDLMSDFTKRDTYYLSTLNTKVKMNWTDAQYAEAMNLLNSRALAQQYNAAAALARYNNNLTTIYAKFIEQYYPLSTPTITNGGSSYAVGDLVVLGNQGTFTTPLVLRVTTVSGGVITGVAIYYGGQYSVAPTGTYTQSSTSGAGTGATFSGGAFSANWSSLAGTQGSVDYCKIPGVDSGNISYLGTHGYPASSIALWTSSETCFNQMSISPGSTTAYNFVPGNGWTAMFAHMIYVLQNGTGSGAKNSTLLQCFQGHLQWVMGANLRGESQTTMRGVRSVTNFLHEDTRKMGYPFTPPGIIPLGWFSWAPEGRFTFQGVGTNTDAVLVEACDNVTGLAESNVIPGSAKLWSNWRFGSSFWEFQELSYGGAPFVIEYTQLNICQILGASLYLHGWDGNV